MRNAHSSHRGSALAALILVLTCTAMVAWTVGRISLWQSGHAQKTIHRLQAQQAARAGLEFAKWRLSMLFDKGTYVADDLTFTEAMPVGNNGRFEVRVRPYGAYVEVVSFGLCVKEEVGARVLLGVGQPSWFSRALTLNRSPMPLTLTSGSKIVGDVAVSQQNVSKGRMPGTPVPTGPPDIRGRIIGEPSWPVFRRVGLQATVDQLDRYISILRSGPAPSVDVLSGSRYTLQQLEDASTDRIIFLSARIVQIESGEGSQLMSVPLTIVSTGEIHLSGSMDLSSGLVVAAGDLIRLSGDCRAVGGILYSTESVELTGQSILEGQAISGGRIEVSSSARVRFPGVLYAIASQDSAKDQGIRITSTEEQSGTIVSLTGNRNPPRLNMAGPIVLDRKPGFTGLIYGEGVVDLNGHINGSVTARVLQFEHRGTTYINWLRDVVLDRTVLNDAFVLPFGFDSKAEMEIVSWTWK